MRETENRLGIEVTLRSKDGQALTQYLYWGDLFNFKRSEDDSWFLSLELERQLPLRRKALLFKWDSGHFWMRQDRAGMLFELENDNGGTHLRETAAVGDSISIMPPASQEEPMRIYIEPVVLDHKPLVIKDVLESYSWVEENREWGIGHYGSNGSSHIKKSS